MPMVWRVENDEGTGPYGCYENWREGDHCDRRHPDPYDDAGLRDHWRSMPFSMKQQYFFGFDSYEQAREWFTASELRTLYQYGYNLKRVRAKEVIHGVKQLIFRR